jgi:hypothetical protein
MRLSTIGGAIVLAVFVMAAVTLRASDMVGVYTVVEKIVVEPTDAAPQRIQIWGAFALADQQSRNDYGPAQRGYLYYSCPSGQEAVCRREWADLKTVAGKDTGVGFGARYKPTGRVRKADEKPAAPDEYPIERGILRLSAGHESLPVIDRLKAALRQR